MAGTAFIKTFSAPPVSRKEILRYAGCKNEDDGVARLLDDCLDEAMDKLRYSVCYRMLSIEDNDGEVCRFGPFSVRSAGLAKTLAGCGGAVVFGATIGVEIDRLISRYGRLSPSRALLLQALGAERIEALCDVFCKGLEAEKRARLTMRFSPGYGDLPLETQVHIFSVLDLSKNIGLTLNKSLLMSPSKSVTAFAGVKSEGAL